MLRRRRCRVRRARTDQKPATANPARAPFRRCDHVTIDRVTSPISKRNEFVAQIHSANLL
eukprot:5052473-Prymnesium_polylepis.1